MVLDYQSGVISARLETSEKLLVGDVSFSLNEGESLALIGETGSGKTVTALSIMGLLPSNVSVSGGNVEFQGRQLSGDRRNLLGVEMVYIPQNGLEFLNPSRKVRHHLYDNLQKIGVHRKSREAEAIKRLLQVGFCEPEKVIDQYSFQLSGGMAQRVTIAIAACSHARLVIADEPTNGLDYETKVQFMDMLHLLFPDAAKLIITHDIEVAKLCDRVLVLCGGKMIETGVATQVLEQPKHPYTRALMGALVKNGMKETPVLRRGVHECPFYLRCSSVCESCARIHCSEGEREWWCSQS